MISPQRWNKCICELDSDGDNRANGVELGDPDCTWTEGTLPPTTAGLTHPGFWLFFINNIFYLKEKYKGT